MCQFGFDQCGSRKCHYRPTVSRIHRCWSWWMQNVGEHCCWSHSFHLHPIGYYLKVEHPFWLCPVSDSIRRNENTLFVQGLVQGYDNKFNQNRPPRPRLHHNQCHSKDCFLPHWFAFDWNGINELYIRWTQE